MKIRPLISLAGFSAVAAYIWWLRIYFTVAEFFLPLLVIMLVSNFCFGDGLSRIGLWPDDFWRCFRERGKQLVILSLLLFLWIDLSGRMPGLFVSGKIGFLAKYIFAGLAQQYILNGFFVNHLIGFFGHEKNKNIIILSTCAFSLLHLPNLFLMFVGGLGGYVCIKTFIEYRNLYFLGLAHGLIAFLLFHAFPEDVTHHFVVGIKYFAD